MREDEFARLIDDAVGALRREAGEAGSPVQADAPFVVGYVYEAVQEARSEAEPSDREGISLSFASPYAIADALQSVAESGVAEDWPHDLPQEVTLSEVAFSEEITFSEEIVVVDDLSDAAIIAAKFVPQAIPLEVPDVRLPPIDKPPAPAIPKRGPGIGVALIAAALLVSVGWHLMDFAAVCRPPEPGRVDASTRSAANIVAAWIVAAESSGDAKAKNKRSSATGAGQFLDGTWLDMIRAHRPDLVGKSDAEILEMRHDPELSREMVARFAEGNAALLARRCLPVTAGTLYLAHFAGGAGAAAVLLAPDDADAATTIAEADARGKLTREKIVTANPFLARFTVADLKHWADRKMVAAAGARLSSM